MEQDRRRTITTGILRTKSVAGFVMDARRRQLKTNMDVLRPT
jgi:hypothetical protein